MLWRYVRESWQHWSAAGPSPTRLIAQGDEARREKDWPTALEKYDEALRRRPERYSLLIKRGRVLDELKRFQEAEGAYRQAAQVRPHSGDAYFYLGRSLRLQNRVIEATKAYTTALSLGDARARSELLATAGRRSVPDAGQRENLARILGEASELAAELNHQFEAAISASAFSPQSYPHLRRRLLPDAPPTVAQSVIGVLVDARHASPARILLTLTSIADQSGAQWRTAVLTDEDLDDHPVSSASHCSDAVTFLSRSQLHQWAGAFDEIIVAEAGASLDPHCLSWLSFAKRRAKAAMGYSDFDHCVHHWRGNRPHVDPVLFGAPDEIGLESGGSAPPVAIFAATEIDRVCKGLLSDAPSQELHRQLIIGAIRRGLAVTHVPRLLFSVTRFDDRAPSPVEAGHHRADSAVDSETRILVVIPTRNEGVMLDRLVTTLRAKAEAPRQVNILVIDNRSSQQDTLDTLSRLGRDNAVEVRRIDEPFNWARFNNTAVAGRQEDIFLFMNNDMEMLTDRWDTALRRSIGMAGGGCVGALLQYPDGSIQHAGVLLGALDGMPLHDGLDANADAPGPDQRWLRSRRCAAVTGAFLAVGRSTFEAAQGFDERLAVGYSDIDFCLRCRQLDVGVIYDPMIRAVHFESKTRGINDTAEKVAWDNVELDLFFRTWGEAAISDPGRNPQWVAEHRNAYDGLCNPPLSAILAYIDRISQPKPWAIRVESSGNGDPFQGVS